MKIVTIDAVGKQCPIPVVMATKALEELDSPAVVKVHVDNEIAVKNLKKMAENKSLTSSDEKLDDHHFVVSIAAVVMEEGEEKSENPEEECCCVSSGRAGDDFVVAIDGSTMGRGNDELGKVLMKGFIYALSQLEKLPKTILFYNGGAVLTTEGSDSLEDLRAMEEQGVVIKTCGTCLNYYQLTDKLAVGEVTNMYDIVETLAKASKVIKP